MAFIYSSGTKKAETCSGTRSRPTNTKLIDVGWKQQILLVWGEKRCKKSVSWVLGLRNVFRCFVCFQRFTLVCRPTFKDFHQTCRLRCSLSLLVGFLETGGSGEGEIGQTPFVFWWDGVINWENRVKRGGTFQKQLESGKFNWKWVKIGAKQQQSAENEGKNVKRRWQRATTQKMGENVENKRKNAENLGNGRKLVKHVETEWKWMTNLSNTAFFCHVAVFLARFLLIFSILLDSPRFSSILLECCSWQKQRHFRNVRHFTSFWGLFFPKMDILYFFEPFSPKNGKVASFWSNNCPFASFLAIFLKLALFEGKFALCTLRQRSFNKIAKMGVLTSKN